MSVEDDIRQELRENNNDKAALMQKISDRQKQIILDYGGSVSDVPVDSNHEYWANNRKLNLLNNLKVGPNTANPSNV